MSLYCMSFSPTGGTEKVANILCENLGSSFQKVDLCDPNISPYSFEEDDLVVIAVPSYAGRVPSLATSRIQKMNGNKAKAILVSVYGNRAFEDTLVELQDICMEQNFVIVAGVAAIAEHSIARQFATGRPDSEDATQLKAFALQILDHLATNQQFQIHFPGNRPYKKTSGKTMVPKATHDCLKCGLCARQCPAQAINLLDPTETDSHQCIGCMRCVQVCPEHARKLSKVLLLAAGTALKKVCSERKENELFI